MARERAVAESGGYGEAATDEEIVEAIKLLAQTEGIFTETAGGVTVAVARKLIASGRLPADESIVICITGNGLKTTEPLAHRLGEPLLIEPSLASFEERASHVLEGALA